MKILIATVGTRGDVQPYIALACGLKSAGHDVVICTCPQFQAFIEEYGIDFEPLEDGLIKLLQSDFGKAVFEDLNSVLGVIKTIPRVLKMVGPIHRNMVDDSWTAVEKHQPDAIVYHPKMFCIPAFAAVTNIPILLAMLCPLHVPTGEAPMFGRSLGRYYNRATYRIVHVLTKLGIRGYLSHWRKENDKAKKSKYASSTHVRLDEVIPVIHAHSKAVSPRPKDWPAYSTVSGYWFLQKNNKEAVGHEPTEALLEFLASGHPPVYFGFGSMVGTNPEKLTKIILDTVERTGVRAIISTGWGGVREVSNSPDVYMLESVSHEWLFPQTACVVHHGGAGTTAAGLRAGRPTIICPFGLDQPFWGRCVSQIGAGVKPIPQKKLSVEVLSEAIIEVTENQSYLDSAKLVAESINAEDGIANAIEVIDQLVPKLM